MNSRPHIAFVIDTLPSLGGGEKVLFSALDLFPQADIFTLVYNKDVFASTPIANRKIRSSFINSIPLAHKNHRLFLPLMPAAIEHFDLRDYDIVVCFNYAVAHGIKNINGARHLAYTYTPMRYAWTNINIDGTRTRKNLITGIFMNAFRRWDKKAASRVHQFATISQAVFQRIQLAYDREAVVIHPPVEVGRFKPAQEREDYYITVTRLVAHKRVDLLVQAFSKLNLPLLIIGDGPELPRLQNLAAPNIHFLGYQPDELVAEILGKARGFVCATEEDFGIAIVEAQAAGCPIIAYGRGGALETVINNKTGIFFDDQSVESLISAIQIFEKIYRDFDHQTLVQNAERFDTKYFIQRFRKFVIPKV